MLPLLPSLQPFPEELAAKLFNESQDLTGRPLVAIVAERKVPELNDKGEPTFNLKTGEPYMSREFTPLLIKLDVSCASVASRRQLLCFVTLPSHPRMPKHHLFYIT